MTDDYFNVSKALKLLPETSDVMEHCRVTDEIVKHYLQNPHSNTSKMIVRLLHDISLLLRVPYT